MKQLKLILRLARLHFLVPGFMLYLLGYLLALFSGVEYDLIKFVFGYLVFGTAHLSISFSNDYFDRDSDKNSIKTSFSGGSKVLVKHPELQSFALRFAVFLLCLSIMASMIFTFIYGYTFWFVILVILGGLLGWFYSAPPLNLSYRGLSELSAMIAIGFFIPGIGYLVASGTIDSLFQIFVLPLSCYGLFFIITVEFPDVESDSIGEKKNVLVNYGRNVGKSISVAATLIGTVYLALLLFLGIIEETVNLWPFVIFSFFPLLSSIVGYFWITNTRKFVVRQVMFNVVSIILFLFLVDVSLILQNIL